jgi:DNA invertase Pin-like site-specific DNA recombinase
MVINAAIYARSFPDCPVSAEDQTDHLKAVASDRGWTVIATFNDRPMSIRASKDRRLGENALVDAVRRGGVQKVLLWDVDRVGRSLTELVAFIETCRAAGVGLYLHEPAMDTATSNGISLFDLAGMMAHHLRQSHRDRILRGQHAARVASSVRFGRPPLPASKVDKAKQGLAAGKGVRAVARLVGISAASVSRLKASMG